MSTQSDCADTFGERLAALVALFAPTRASNLPAALDCPESAAIAARVAELLRLPRLDRLEALRAAWVGTDRTERRARAAALSAGERQRISAALQQAALDAIPSRATALFHRLLDEQLTRPAAEIGTAVGGEGGRFTPGQPAARSIAAAEPVASLDTTPAWPVKGPSGMAAFPFKPSFEIPIDLPMVSAGFAALSPAARDAGRRAAGRAAIALAEQIGGPVELTGVPLPGLASPSTGAVRLGLSLAAVPAEAVLEVEAGLAARLADRLAGGAGETPAALELTPVERCALDLLALVALTGAAAEERVASALAPRLTRSVPDLRSPLAVELTFRAGTAQGRCRLLLPASVVRALDFGGQLSEPAASWTLEGGLRSGASIVDPADLAGLRPGDVVMLDDPPSARCSVSLPGFTLRGRSEDDLFTFEEFEEIAMNESQAQLPVTLVVEVARVTLTLGDLARLEPGAAFPLHVPRDGQALLRLGERAVARGQLVDVEGALGVRIDSLVPAP